ncbi:MAG TPA: MarR family transcriptional regulator [Gaiellaceae bacterium]|nr:MarR family transcriptional regulator [Gaiellaceae bacterium]
MAVTAEPATDVAREAWELIFRVARARHGVLSSRLADLDLTPVQAHALRRLDPDEPLAMSALAEALYCHASNVTGIVDRLESRGLVERTPGAGDRRVKTLVLTPEGAEVRARVIELLSEPPAVIAALPAADQRALRDILHRALADETTTVRP